MSADKEIFRYNIYHEKIYGPIGLPSETCGTLCDEQERYVWREYNLWATVGNLGRVTVHEALPVCFG